MQTPQQPDNESMRLGVLDIIGQIDTEAEERFDRIVEFSKLHFQVPIALVSLIDAERQWFKARSGLDIRETPRSVSFCGYTITMPDVFVVEDALEDERFFDNPMVTGHPKIRFYAGAPLEIFADVRVGSLCLIDTVPRSFSIEQMRQLRRLGDMARDELVRSPAQSIQELTPIAKGHTAFNSWRERFLSKLGR